MIYSYHYDHDQEAYKSSLIKFTVSLTSHTKDVPSFLKVFIYPFINSLNKYILSPYFALFWAKGFSDEQN